MKIGLIAHNSLDGGVCTILGAEASENIECICYSDFGVANSEITTKLEAFQDDPEIELIIIAGLPLAPQVGDWITDNIAVEKILVVNHHDVGFGKNPASWLREDPFTPSASLLYEELTTRTLIDSNNGRLIAFVELNRIFTMKDIHHPFFGIGKDLDRLYHFLGIDNFVERGYFQGFTPAEKYALEMLQLKEVRTLRDIEFHCDRDVRDLKFIWAIGTGDDYLVGVIGFASLNKGSYHDFTAPDYGVVICPEKETVFLFSNGEVDVGNIARSVKGYGTRTEACFKLPLMENPIAQVKKILMLNK